MRCKGQPPIAIQVGLALLSVALLACGETPSPRLSVYLFTDLGPTSADSVRLDYGASPLPAPVGSICDGSLPLAASAASLSGQPLLVREQVESGLQHVRVTLCRAGQPRLVRNIEQDVRGDTKLDVAISAACAQGCAGELGPCELTCEAVCGAGKPSCASNLSCLEGSCLSLTGIARGDAATDEDGGTQADASTDAGARSDCRTDQNKLEAPFLGYTLRAQSELADPAVQEALSEGRFTALRILAMLDGDLIGPFQDWAPLEGALPAVHGKTVLLQLGAFAPEFRDTSTLWTHRTHNYFSAEELENYRALVQRLVDRVRAHAPRQIVIGAFHRAHMRWVIYDGGRSEEPNWVEPWPGRFGVGGHWEPLLLFSNAMWSGGVGAPWSDLHAALRRVTGPFEVSSSGVSQRVLVTENVVENLLSQWVLATAPLVDVVDLHLVESDLLPVGDGTLASDQVSNIQGRVRAFYQGKGGVCFFVGEMFPNHWGGPVVPTTHQAARIRATYDALHRAEPDTFMGAIVNAPPRPNAPFWDVGYRGDEPDDAGVVTAGP